MKTEKAKENKIGVITRGKIKLSKQIDFWLNVSSASDAIKNADGVEFYKGLVNYLYCPSNIQCVEKS